MPEMEIINEEVIDDTSQLMRMIEAYEKRKEREELILRRTYQQELYEEALERELSDKISMTEEQYKRKYYIYCKTCQDYCHPQEFKIHKINRTDRYLTCSTCREKAKKYYRKKHT